ncbi:CsbD family protein [Pararhodobacter sp.]|uniref:CsbD family protein n=1 Tax=Pararhodobacter sp. TaxID=2127056 RepID=UPI002FDF7B05|nr:CsbD family protein [Pseudomonadota bacterium]
MNSDTVEGKWKQIKGEAKIQWGKLTNDDLDVVEGHKDKLVGKIQERYGKSKDEAEAEVNRFWSKY